MATGKVDIPATEYDDSALSAAITNLRNAMMVVSNGNTHDAVTRGDQIYVMNHSTLTEGPYLAKSNISANASLTSSNLQSLPKGGLNYSPGRIYFDGTWLWFYPFTNESYYFAVTNQLEAYPNMIVMQVAINGTTTTKVIQ